MNDTNAKSNAREGDGVAGLPPEAVPVGPDGLRFGVISSHDWAIPAPFGARIVDARMAHGWNECRKEMIAMQAQQGAEPVAWEMNYPKAMPTISVIAAPEFVRSEQRAAHIASECDRLYGEAATFRAVTYARTGAPR